MKELKPCPFCGGDAQIYGHLKRRYEVTCENCGIIFPPEQDCFYTSEKAAIEKWNTRKEVQA